MVRLVIFLLTAIAICSLAFAQPANDLCGNALDLCPNVSLSVSNQGASSSVCANCEDDFNYCFDPEATVWFSITTNAAGGDLTVDISNAVFQANPGQDQELQAALISAVAPCDASTYTLVGSCIVSGTAASNLTAVGLAPSTTYYLVLGGDFNGAGITSAASFTADLLLSGPGVDRPNPALALVQSGTNICQNDIVTFTAGVTDCPDSSDYHWYVNGSLAAVTTDNFWTAGQFSDGDVVRVEIDCYADCPVRMGLDANPLSVYSFFLDAGVDLYLDLGTSAQLSGVTSAPVFTWTPSFDVSNPNVLNPIVEPNETTVFTLTAEENGCTQSDQVTVFISRGLEIPNTFSPNEDGSNDFWEILGIDAFPDNSVSLFTRWGQEVFTLSSYSEEKFWDGTMRSGSKASEGVYYYIIDLGDGSELIRGTLNLIR